MSLFQANNSETKSEQPFTPIRPTAASERSRGAPHSHRGLRHQPNPQSLEGPSVDAGLGELASLDQQEPDASQLLENWMESYDYEQQNFNSMAQYTEVKLHEAFRSSATLGVPNAFRTAICCDLLDKVGSMFGRYEKLMTLLKSELYCSIYADHEKLAGRLQSGPVSARTFFEAEPYFTKVQQLLAVKGELEAEISSYERQKRKMQGELRKKQSVLNATCARWQNTLKLQAFRMWRKCAVSRKRQREMLLLAFHRWEKKRLRILLREWRLVVEKGKRGRADSALTSARTKCADMETSKRALEEERSAAEAKVRALRLDLESAQGELGALSREMEGVQQQLADSKEDDLRLAAEAWAELASCLAGDRLGSLRQKLDEVAAEDYVDLPLLLRKGEAGAREGGVGYGLPRLAGEVEASGDGDGDGDGEFGAPAAGGVGGGGSGGGVAARESMEAMEAGGRVLLSLPVDVLLLRWVNYHLKVAKYPKVVENLGSDLRDSEEYAVLLAAVTATTLRLKPTLRNEDLEARAVEIVARVNRMGCPEIISANDIASGAAPDLNLAMVAYLMCRFPSLSPAVPSWGAVRREVDAVGAEWELLKQMWEENPAEVDTERVRAAGERLAEVEEEVRVTLAKRQLGLDLWTALRSRVQACAWDLLLRRGRGEPVPILDRREMRERKAYTRLNRDDPWLQLVLQRGSGAAAGGSVDMEAELVRLHSCLETHYVDLKRIFRHYSAGDGGGRGGTMNVQEFWTLVKECKLPSRNLTLSAIQNIFAEANEQGFGIEDPNNPDCELMANEFVEALVRVADAKFKDRAELSLSARLQQLMQQYILTHACRSDAHRFRQELAHPRVKAVFRKYRERLQVIYREAAGGDRSMNAMEFQAFVTSRRLLDAGFTTGDLFNIFNKIQDDEDVGAAATGAVGAGEVAQAEMDMDMELSYSEYLEGLAAIAVYKDPDPYVPLSQKLERFITEVVDTKHSKKK